jgi:hypothetical protein
VNFGIRFDSFPKDKRQKGGGGQTKNIWLAEEKNFFERTAPCRKYVETI